MRFEIVITGSTGKHFEANGLPHDSPLPDWFVTDSGWIYPVTSVMAFLPLKPDQALGGN